MEALALFVQILAYILLAAIFLRVIFSWIAFDPSNPLYTVIHDITEPILAPLRQIMPRIGMIDLSPMVAI
ncbi:MAG: YggT family protein, partial [Chloroflexi bacterium]|nr:YggT family protein [Chloroflexota bacterium]